MNLVQLSKVPPSYVSGDKLTHYSTTISLMQCFVNLDKDKFSCPNDLNFHLKFPIWVIVLFAKFIAIKFKVFSLKTNF